MTDPCPPEALLSRNSVRALAEALVVERARREACARRHRALTAWVDEMMMSDAAREATL